MVKKLKAIADKKEPQALTEQETQLVAAVKDSAQQIWLAGLGAFMKAQEEGTKIFDALVQEGKGLQKKTKTLAGDSLSGVTGAVSGVSGKLTKVTGDLSKQATQSWDKLEEIFEDRVARALNRLGIPTNKDIQDLTQRVETLTAALKAVTSDVKPTVVKTSTTKTSAPRTSKPKAVKTQTIAANDATSLPTSTADTDTSV
jgi:poly(hydroxyalkanoate) granule-associated protein